MSDLTSDGIEKYFSAFKAKNYKKGQIILHPDEEIPRDIYYIEKGHVKVYSLTESGNEMTHIFFGPAEMFPLVSFFKRETRDIFFEAMEDVVIKKAGREEFMTFIKSDSRHLLEIIDRMSNILKVYANRIDDLEYTKAYTKVVSRLISLSRRFGKEYNGRVILDIPVTHKDIANTINLTRETTTRELLFLMGKGLIVQNGHLIVIKDLKKLEKSLKILYKFSPEVFGFLVFVVRQVFMQNFYSNRIYSLV